MRSKKPIRHDFKIDDRVRCIDKGDTNFLVVNRIYTVKDILRGNYLVFHEILDEHNYSADRFELFKEELPEDLFEL